MYLQQKENDFFDNIIIVSLAKVKWNFPYWVSRQSLMYELSKFFPVLYATDREPVTAYSNYSFYQDFFLPAKPPYQPPCNLKISKKYFYFPQNYKFKKLDSIVAKGYGRALRRECIKKGYKKIIAYVWDYKMIDYISGLNPVKIIYHPYDKMDYFVTSEEKRELIVNAEKKIVDICDAVITPHQKIADFLQHPNSHIVNNAVFTKVFKKPDFNQTGHGIYNHLKKPVIGYLGVFNKKIDISLLIHIAREKPEWSFMFVGPVHENSMGKADLICLKELKSLNNVYFSPPVRFDEISIPISHMDVGIIPYNMKSWVKFSESPLKLYQYMAAGIPSVVPELPNISHRPGMISVASSDHKDWISKIEYEYKNNCDRLISERKKNAHENSWEKRAIDVMQIICDLFS